MDVKYSYTKQDVQDIIKQHAELCANAARVGGYRFDCKEYKENEDGSLEVFLEGSRLKRISDEDVEDADDEDEEESCDGDCDNCGT